MDADNQWTQESKSTQYVFLTQESKKSIRVDFYTLYGVHKGWEYYSVYKKGTKIKDGIAHYLYPNGADSLICIYANDKLVGKSVSYYPNSQENTIINYREGVPHGDLIQFFPTGEFRRNEKYNEGVCITGQFFDENGNELPFEPYFIESEFPGGKEMLYKFISQTINYPPSALKRKAQGTVLVSFIIEKDGSMSSISLKQSLNTILDAEAIRVIEQMASSVKWEPMKVDGEIVKTRYTLPVVFRLLQ